MSSDGQAISLPLRGYRALTRVAGGMGEDRFAGVAEASGRQVLVHLLPTAPADTVPPAVALARRWLPLDHPNLVHLLAVDRTEDGRWYFATEAVNEDSLAELLARGPLGLDSLGPLAARLGEAINSLHQAGVVLGELRPDDIRVETKSGTLWPRLDGGALAHLGRPGAAFRAPECLAGGPATARSDVYALGALLQSCLTGRPAPPGETLADLQRSQRETTTVLPEGAARLVPVLRRSMAWEPAGRFASAAEVAFGIAGNADTLVPQTPGGKPGLPPPAPSNAPSNASKPAAEGQVLGNYQLLRLLGEGTMGQVFLAKHTLLGRQVAIKVLRREQYRSADLIQRFVQEARTVNQINHEHIVEIFDFVQQTGEHGVASVYFVMELLSGVPLAKLVEGGRLGIRRSVAILCQVCEALAAAHKVGVVHRDVKPDNIFITEQAGLRDYVKVLDFGVAKLTSSVGEAKAVQTMEGALIGTPTYMSPEQASGGAVDGRSDLWAVGVMLYEALAGRVPFEGPNFGALMVQIVTTPAPPLPAATPGGDRIAAPLRAAVMQCLEKEPARRPQTMDELRALLAPFAATEAERYEQRPRRAPLWIAGAVGLAVAGTLAARVHSRAPLQQPAEAAIPAAVAARPAPAPAPLASPAPPLPAATPVAQARPKAAERPRSPLAKAAIAAAVSRSKGALSRCFERHRGELPGSAGKITIAFVIEPSGAVRDSHVTTAGLGTGSLADCVAKEGKRVQFPAHGGPTVAVTVPFSYAIQ